MGAEMIRLKQTICVSNWSGINRL